MIAGWFDHVLVALCSVWGRIDQEQHSVRLLKGVYPAAPNVSRRRTTRRPFTCTPPRCVLLAGEFVSRLFGMPQPSKGDASD
jgi:hypothetical protein